MEGCTVNKRFPNLPVGHPRGLIGSLVCLCQAAMPTLWAPAYPDPALDKQKAERKDGRMSARQKLEEVGEVCVGRWGSGQIGKER